MPRTGIRKKSEAARQNLLDAALQVIGSKGYSGATMDGIAKAAGVSKGLAYYHFANKAKLAAAVLDNGLGTLVEQLRRAGAECESAAEAMDAMVEVLGDKLYSNKLVSRFVFEEMFREDRDCSEVVHTYIQTFLGLIEELIARGQAEGAFSAALDAQFTAVSLFGAVMTASMYYTGLAEGVEPLSQADFTARLKSQALAICRA